MTAHCFWMVIVSAGERVATGRCSTAVNYCGTLLLVCHRCVAFAGGWKFWGLGGSNPIAGKIREICRKFAGKLQYSKQRSLTLKEQQSWTGGSDFSFRSFKKSTGSTTTGGAPQCHHGIVA